MTENGKVVNAGNEAVVLEEGRWKGRIVDSGDAELLAD
jgi:hypothetical protein